MSDEQESAADSYASRKAAVAAAGLGDLQEHVCCPQCHAQDPCVVKDVAYCNRCGWKGKQTDLIDTVMAGWTKLPEGA